jgi:hypothetical protein
MQTERMMCMTRPARWIRPEWWMTLRGIKMEAICQESFAGEAPLQCVVVVRGPPAGSVRLEGGLHEAGRSPDQPALVSRLVNEKRSKPNLKKAEAWPCFSCCFGIWSLSCAIRRAMCQAHTQRYLINQSHMVVCVCGGGGHFEVGIGGPA